MRHGLAGATAAVRLLQAHGGKAAGAPLSREHTIETMTRLMRVLSISPADIPPVLHIAGTKGKGSTASMCEAILRSRGLRTGLYTSPHLVDIRERIRINGSLPEADFFCEHFWSAWKTLEAAAAAEVGAEPAPDGACEAPWPPPVATLARMPGFFQFLTLVALRAFAAARVDAAVLEVGLGGRLDATNAVPASAVVACGVAQLDFDHVELLGPTLADIAREKAGIFRPRVPALTVPQRPDAEASLATVARAVGAPLLRVDESAAVVERWLHAAPGVRASEAASATAAAFPPLGLAGAYQRSNAALAVALTDVFFASKRGAAVVAAADARRRGSGGSHDGSCSAAGPDEAALPLLGERVGHLLDAALAAQGTEITRYAPGPACALLPCTLDGLAAAQWPGRAQALPVVAERRRTGGWAWRVADAAAPPPAALALQVDAPAAVVFVDGAHTGRSMRAALEWFLAASHGAGAGEAARPALVPPPPPPRRALVFYCGRDKAAVELLLPLAALQQQGGREGCAFWDAGVFLVAPEQEKATAALPGAAALPPLQLDLQRLLDASASPAPSYPRHLSGPARAALAECADARRGAWPGSPQLSAAVSAGSAVEAAAPSLLSLACAQLLAASTELPPAATAAAGCAGASPAPSAIASSWPSVLMELWQALTEEACFEDARVAEAEGLGMRRRGEEACFEDARAAEAEGLGMRRRGGGSGMGPAAAASLPSADAALRSLAATAAAAAAAAVKEENGATQGAAAGKSPPPPSPPLHVMVTGSLYVVGDALASLGRGRTTPPE